MKIVIDIKPISEIRTIGCLDDYHYLSDGTLLFEIADTGSEVFNKLLVIHGMVEEILTHDQGISGEAITAFDKEPSESEEPGEEINAPYRDAHLIADAVERILLANLRIPIKVYNASIVKTLDGGTV